MPSRADEIIKYPISLLHLTPWLTAILVFFGLVARLESLTPLVARRTELFVVCSWFFRTFLRVLGLVSNTQYSLVSVGGVFRVSSADPSRQLKFGKVTEIHSKIFKNKDGSVKSSDEDVEEK